MCRASHDDISKAAVDMLEPYFHTNTTDVHTVTNTCDNCIVPPRFVVCCPVIVVVLLLLSCYCCCPVIVVLVLLLLSY